ncbi:L,D-transpeptidase [Myxococcota bacterium]|nr:L,D-transpeptidase [Myxococcota bacterium]
MSQRRWRGWFGWRGWRGWFGWFGCWVVYGGIVWVGGSGQQASAESLPETRAPSKGRDPKKSERILSDGSKETTRKRLLPKGWEQKARMWQQQRRCLWEKAKGKPSKRCRRYANKAKNNDVFLVVVASEKTMRLCRGDRVLRTWPVGHGRKGFGKQREGDKKTPLGTYRITWMAARHEPRLSDKIERQRQRYRIVARRAFCMHNRVTRLSEFRRDKGPRDERLWLRPYGGRYATVMALDYPNESDQKSGRTGSCIEIHASYHLDGSAGCLTLFPHHAVSLYNCLAPQTRVEIVAR